MKYSDKNEDDIWKDDNLSLLKFKILKMIKKIYLSNMFKTITLQALFGMISANELFLDQVDDVKLQATTHKILECVLIELVFNF